MYIFNRLVELESTNHAKMRMAQRHVTRFELEYVLEQGHRDYRGGYLFYVLRSCDIPDGLWRHFSHLTGTTIVFCPQSRKIVTVYKDHSWRRSGRRMRREPKRRRTREEEWKYH